MTAEDLLIRDMTAQSDGEADELRAEIGRLKHSVDDARESYQLALNTMLKQDEELKRLRALVADQALTIGTLKDEQGRHFDVMNERNGAVKYLQTAHADIAALQAKLARVEALPAKWLALHAAPQASLASVSDDEQMAYDCAMDLQAALKDA